MHAGLLFKQNLRPELVYGCDSGGCSGDLEESNLTWPVTFVARSKKL